MAIQDKFNKPNIIYKITQDIDLNGGTLTIPSGCTLDFQGGTISNGTINGDILNDYLKPEWFGAKADGITDDTDAVKMCLSLGVSTLKFTSGTYIVHELLINNINIVIDKAAVVTVNKQCKYIFGLDYINSNEQIPKAGISGSGKINCNHLSDYGIIINRGLRTHITGLFIKNPVVACVKRGSIIDGDPIFGMCEISNLYLLNEKNGNNINSDSVGIEMEGHDNRVSHIEAQDFKYTIKEIGGGNIYNDIHGWLYTDGVSMFADSSLFYIDTYNWIFINNSVSDTIRRFLKTSGLKDCIVGCTNCSLFHNSNVLNEQVLKANPSIIFDKNIGDIININNQYINSLYNVDYTIVYSGRVNKADSINISKEYKRGEFSEKESSIQGNMYFVSDKTKPIWFNNNNNWVDSDGADSRATRNGDMSDRPIKEYIYPGFKFFDTSINKPIWWNGTKWVGENTVVNAGTF